MILDASEIPARQTIATTVCIVGGGPAGITIARELGAAGINTVVLEGGGLEPEERSQALYQGRVVDDRYTDLDVTRLRYLGGSTNHWAGFCRPLDPIDFERGWPDAGATWPIALADLDPFYRRAHALCQLGPFNYDPQFWRHTLASEGDHFDRAPFEPVVHQYSPPTRFGEVYRGELDRLASIKGVINANFHAFEFAPEANAATHVAARRYDGVPFRVQAKHFLLATGGIENARILLNERDRLLTHGLARASAELIGRHFNDHLVIGAGVLLVSRPGDFPALFLSPQSELPREGPPTTGPFINNGGVRLRHDILRAHGLVNVWARFLPIHSEAVASARALRRGGDRAFWRHVGEVARGIDDVADAVWEELLGDGPETAQRSSAGTYRIEVVLEQKPNPASRVTLTNDRDAMGLRRAALDWRFSAAEFATVRRFMRLLGEFVGAEGIGRVRNDLPGDDAAIIPMIEPAQHHISTTRMSDAPVDGVVDRDCRVHGLANLYVAGSSVYPVAGVWNPTLTNCALALRLADQLKEQS